MSVVAPLEPARSWVAPGLFDPSCGAWPFGDLVPGSYDLIMADPPWQFELYSAAGADKSADAHYQTMDIKAIAALPVADLARPDCLLWLWATAPMLPHALAVMGSWGFQFKTSGVWVKTTKRGKTAFGTGYILRNAHESVLIGTRGAPVTAKDVRSVVMAEAREHSRKPRAAFEAAERLVPGAVRCELFSRARRRGWESWGNEVEKFEADEGDDNGAA